MMKKVFSILLVSLVNISVLAQGGVEGAPVSVKTVPSIVVIGQPVTISGTVMVNDKTQSLSMKVQNPGGQAESFTVTTDIKGIFTKTYTATSQPGWYAVTITAQDGKGAGTDSFFVSTPAGAANSYLNRVNALQAQAQRNITAVLDRLSSFPSDAQLEANRQKLQQARQRLHELRTRMETAGTGFSRLLTELSTVPPATQLMQRHHAALQAWQEEADEQIPQLESQVQQFENVSTTCENINNLTETLSLISWIMNFQGNFAKILVNIASDKVLPGAVDRMEISGTDLEKETKKLAVNEAQKTMTAAVQGFDEIRGSITGLTGDVFQFVSKVMYAQRCVDLKGPATLKFTANMYNGNLLYWKYSVDLTGTLVLRYEKNADLSKPSEITGEFEGFRTRYDFWEKIESVEPFPKGAVILKRITRTPKVVNASAISNDIALAGRTVVPGSYRVKVKGKIINNQLTLEVVRSPLDYAERTEHNKMYLFMVNPVLPVPVIKTFAFPIAKSRGIVVVGLGENYVLPLSKSGEKLSVRKTFTNTKELGAEIKLSSAVSINISN